MKSRPFFERAAFVLSVIVILMSGTIYSTDAFGQAVTVNNVVLVHGIFVDGSGWEGVYKILTARGYHVTIVQNPTTSLEDDVAAVNRALDKQQGPVILVGHSWGGAVITEAGVSPKVAGLVYIAAFQPDAGESALMQYQSAPALIEGCILPPDSAGFFYADKAKFRACSSADLPADKVAFMSDSHPPTTGRALSTPLTQAAWKTKPCWGIVPTADKSINPVIQRAIYKRSGTKVTEIEGASHFAYISQPAAVANVIEAAAKGSLRN
jgi:pimeloyl-ACP methyl ester carboxylesterase